MLEFSKLRKQYYLLMPRLTKVVAVVTTTLQSLNNCVIETGFKPFNSVARKMSKNNLDNMLELSDLVRGRLFFPISYSHKEIIRILCDLLKDFIKDIDWKSTNKQGLKYKGIIHFDLSIDGINFELQVLPIEFRPYKEKLHQIYELLRSKNSLSDKHKNRLKKIHNTIYRVLNEQAFINRNIILRS